MTNSPKSWLLPLVAVIILLLIIATIAGVFNKKIQPGLNENTSIDKSSAIPVQSQSIPIVESVPASVEAKQGTLISSRIMARITSINVRSGDSVTEGQVLLSLEKTDLKARAQQAKEQIRSITARLKQAKQSLQRVRKLHQQRLSSDADLDKALANNDVLTANLAAAQQALEEAQTAVSFTEIRSPINGRIVDRFAEPGDTAHPGVKLLSLYNPLSLRIAAQVREELVLSLSIGQKVTVEIPALNKVVPAEVEERVPAADTGSRSFLVKVRVPYNANLLPGMYARLLIPAGVEQRILVPKDRVAQVGQLNVVWVLDKDQSHQRFVRIGRLVKGNLLEITSGLNTGDYLLPLPDK